MMNIKKILLTLFACLFILSSCATVNETISTGYDSLIEGTESVKNTLASGYERAKSTIRDL